MTVPIARRKFVVALAGAAAWPLAAGAQQRDRMRRIGVLMGGNENNPLGKARLSAFTQALADWGWTDGRNARIDLRWPGTDGNRMRALARDLVGLQPDIIVTSGTVATVAVQRDTRKSRSSLRARATLSPTASSRGSTSRGEHHRLRQQRSRAEW